MSENSLSELQKSLGLSNVENAKKELAMSGLLGGAGYLGELRLVGFSGDLVTTFNQKAGDFCYKHDKTVTALGRDVDVVPLAVRAKAIDFNGPTVSYNPQSPLFRDIQNRAGGADSGCAVGPEFLVYIPSVKKFACFHAGSASARRTASELLDRMVKPAHGHSELAENKKKQKWFVPTWSDSNAEFEAPEQEAVLEAMTLFKKSEEKEPVTAPKDDNSGRVV